MAFSDAELEKKLKDVGKQLSHPPDSVDELVAVLDKVEKLLLKVDQSPKKSMLEAMKPSMNALIKDSLSKHSDTDVKVAVASCISEITRITAPDAPYSDEQMKDVFELIVSSFEGLADQSSRSYNKRATILETVSKVRSCVIMLDLECDELIVKMFEHFLKSVRDYHVESVFSSMDNIMVLVIEESEEISADMLKPLLATVKKDREGVLPIAHKLGKGVLLKSADKLKPYLMPALTSLGESLDGYHKVVAAVCEGKTANFDDNDDNDSGLQLANESKVEKGSVDEATQADENKLTTASSDHVEQEVKEDVCTEKEVDPTVENRSPKSVMSNGVNVTLNEEVSVDQESKKPEEDKSEEPLNKEDTDDSDADKLAKEQPQTGKASEQSEKEADAVTNSAEPSDSSHVEGNKEIEKDNDVKESEKEKDSDVKESENENEKESDVKEPENEKDSDVKESEMQNEKDSDVKESETQNEKDDVKESETPNEKDDDVKESENEAIFPSETKKDKDTVEESSPKAVESKPAATANVSSENNNVPNESSVRSETKPDPQEDETASPSKSVSPAEETHEKVSLPKNKGLAQEVTPEAQKQAGKKTETAKEVKLADPVNKSEDGDGEASSGSDAKPLKKSEAKSKSTKQLGKKSKQSGKKLDVGESDAKNPKQSGKKVDVKGEESDSDAKPRKVSVKKGEKRKIDAEEEDDSDDKPLKLSAKKSALKKKDDGKNKIGFGEEEGRDSDDKPLKQSAKKSASKKKDDGKNKAAADKEEEDDSDNKLLKPLAKKSSSKKKDDGKKRGTGKNVAVKDQAKSQSGDDEMDISPKSGTKSAKKEESSTKTPVTSGKRKRSTVKTEVSDTVKYDESLVGTKVKVWWPEDEMFYEGVVAEFYPDKKKHKISYVDGDEETLNLKTQRWEIVQEFSVRDNEEQNTVAQSEEASPETNKKKKTKTDPAKSQEKNKDSAKRVGGVSSSSKSKGSTPKDKSTKKTSSKSSDTATATSKEAEKSKEDEVTPKTSSKTKTVNKSKGKTTPSSSKSNTNGPTKGKSGSSNVKEPEDVKATENTKSGKKRKKST